MSAASTPSVVDWLIAHKELVFFAVVVAFQMLRGLFRAKRENPEADAKPDELEAERRTREIQEQIRRKRADRRAEAEAAEPPPVMAPVPAPARGGVDTTQMPQPFGGPLRRVFDELQRQAQPPPVPPPVPASLALRSAELTRQEQLAEQLRVLEESRVLAQRRAAEVTAANYAAASSEGGQRTVLRGEILADLRQPASLRRAIILREVLGTPVGLR